MSDTHPHRGDPNGSAGFSQAGPVADREIGSAREQLAGAGQGVREQAGQFAEGARQKATEAGEDGKSRAAGSLDDFTAAIRRASDELGDRDQSVAARLVREAASGLEQASNSIKGSSVNDLVRSTSDFARRQPGAFLVGAALAGVALGRFLRASSDHSDADRLREATGHGGGTGGGGSARGDWRDQGRDGRTIPSDGLNHTREEAPLTRTGSSALAPDASTSFPGGSATPGPASTGGVGSSSAGLGGTAGSTGTTGLPSASVLGTAGASGTTGTRDLSSPNKDSSDER